ncbi:hypothetical protein BJ742DRAFT_829411 [Cladochytrium replicatum]|nr:hypothetical protein BJ742DRAFT_829411 [Cladochytrium replicatum]
MDPPSFLSVQAQAQWNRLPKADRSSVGPPSFPLLIGASGCLGRELAVLLLRRTYSDTGDFVYPRVRLADVGLPLWGETPWQTLSDSELARLDCIKIDVRKFDDVLSASKDVDLVFHVAAVVQLGQYTDPTVRAVNVEGTRNVVNACKQNGIRTLVYTGSWDAVFSSRNTLDRPMDESELVYVEPKLDGFRATDYVLTKTEGEKVALGANNKDGLLVAVARCPHLYGAPEWTFQKFYLASSSPVAPGKPSCRFELMCHRNAAWGHILISDGLRRDLTASSHITAGEVFQLSERYRVNYMDHYGPIVRAAGSRYPTVYIPNAIFYVAAALTHFTVWFWRMVTRENKRLKWDPILSLFVYESVAKSFVVSGEKIRRVLGYEEVISTSEMIEECIDWAKKWAEQRKIQANK